MSDSNQWNPPVEFYFRLDFQNSKGVNFSASFMEVSGLGWSIKSTEVNSQQSMPTEVSYTNLVLKFPVGPLSALFGQWIERCLNYVIYKKSKQNENKIDVYDVIIKLLDASGNPVAAWQCCHAYVVRYTLSQLNSVNSGLAIEMVELTYGRMKRIT